MKNVFFVFFLSLGVQAQSTFNEGCISADQAYSWLLNSSTRLDNRISSLERLIEIKTQGPEEVSEKNMFLCLNIGNLGAASQEFITNASLYSVRAKKFYDMGPVIKFTVELEDFCWSTPVAPQHFKNLDFIRNRLADLREAKKEVLDKLK